MCEPKLDTSLPVCDKRSFVPWISKAAVRCERELPDDDARRLDEAFVSAATTSCTSFQLRHTDARRKPPDSPHLAYRHIATVHLRVQVSELLTLISPSRPNRSATSQLSVGDGILSAAERSVFEISLHHTEGTDNTAQSPRIISVEPNQISSHGHDIVSIIGDFFDAFPEPPATVYVQFGSSEPVVGSVVGSMEIICTAPPITSSNIYSEIVQGFFVLVRVTNQVNFWSNAIQVFVEAPPNVLSISPDAGPSCGGTRVSVVGRNFVSSVSLLCIFGDGSINASTPAKWHSPEELECVSPPWILPAGESEVVVPFSLNTRREHHQQSLSSFRYAAPAVAGSIFPETGQAETWTSVSVTGAHLNGYGLKCISGGRESLPTIQEDDHLECTVPPRGAPVGRTFKIKLAKAGGSGINSRYELVDADVATVRDTLDSTINYAEMGLEPGDFVLPLVRGHQYWLDQSDPSNIGHPITFSPTPAGHNASGREPWTKGVHRLSRSLSAESAGDGSIGARRTGAGVVAFLVPTDAPDVLHIYSESSLGPENGIVAIISDHLEHGYVRVIAAHGSSCDPATHPFR